MYRIARSGMVVLFLAATSCGHEIIDPRVGDNGISEGPAARLRVVHTVLGLSALDVIVGGRVVLASLSFGLPSPFVDVPAGHQTVAFRPAGADVTPHTSSILFAAGDSLTVFAVDSSSIINPWVLTDTGSVVPSDKSKLRVAHFAGTAPAVDIWRTQPDWQQFATVMFPFEYGAASPYMQSGPGVWRVLVSTEMRHNGIPVLVDTLFLSDPIDVPAGESRTVIVLDREEGGLQARVISP